MEFYIKQNSTLPILKMGIIKDGRSDFNLNSFLSDTSTFLISLYDKLNDKFLFASKECFVTSEYSDFEGKNLYYLNYQFTNKDTLKTGRYEVQVSITSEQGVILLPLQEKYYVNVLESFSLNDLGYNTLYTSNLPCCGFQETFDVDGITLDAYYYSGSLIIDYVLTSTKIYNQDIIVDFTNVLEVFTGDPIEIITGVTISSGQTRGITQIIFSDYEYDNLTQKSYLKNVKINENVLDTVFNFDESVVFNTPAPSATPTKTPTGTAIPTSTPTSTVTPSATPTITPTNTKTQTVTPTNTKTQTSTPTVTKTQTSTPTVTKSPTQTITPTNTVTNTQTPSSTPTQTITPTNPCVEYITDEFGNFILTENGDYVISEINPCITPTPTKTTTNTTTQTPTNTPTESLTPTPSVTENPTPTVTPTNTETPTNTPTPSPFYYYYNLLDCDNSNNRVGRSINGGLTGTYNVDVNKCYLIVGIDLGPSYDYDLDSLPLVTDCNDLLCGAITSTPTPTVTETPTNTPTPTNTETPTPTPSSTPTPIIPFISIWSGSSVTLPYNTLGTYSGIIDWGDGSTSANTYSNRNHTYDTEGVYTITISGTVTGFAFGGGSEAQKLREITQFGSLRGYDNSNQGMFQGCSNLVLTGVTDSPNLVGITSMESMFNSCQSLTTVPFIDTWDTSSVTTMYSLFEGCINFDDYIGSWNTAGVTTMENTFQSCSQFNQDISGWDTTNVNNMGNMFYNATLFNQSIGGWKTINVTNMSSMFALASSFNQDLSTWNVSNVTNMNSMFSQATSFNGNISAWVTTNVTDMSSMFYSAVTFNVDIGSWDTSSAVDMGYMFSNATTFNQQISLWNVLNVTNMSRMLENCTSFNVDLGSWRVDNVTDMTGMLDNTAIDIGRYDSLLVGWALLTLQSNIVFGVNGLIYSTGGAGSISRQYIIDTYNWTFVGDDKS